MGLQDWVLLLQSPYVIAGLLILAFGALAYFYLFSLDWRRAKGLEPAPTSQFQLVDGIVIHFQDTGGRGYPIVLLHGIGASIYVWRYLAPLLARKYRVIFIDLPGFGRSTKDPNRDHGLDRQSLTVVRFLDALGVGKCALVGSSMGGAIALWMSKLWPDRFANIVAISPSVSSQLLPVELSRLAKLFLPTTALLMNRTLFRTLVKRVLSRHDKIDDEVIRNYQRPYIEEPKSINTFVRATSILSDPRLPSELKGLKAQVLVLYGAGDKVVPRAVMEQLRTVLPDASFVEHPTAGHHPMEDDPEWIADRISSFL